ncbi:leukocyte elastase inhibitor isoform X2 [Procambarus clarkii]|uniref:leukocyte elastase inhibitor isoform X2 n=1 Tax=Procambarus clarkii TaxID=6728 RepID=UPI001E6770CE|nr:leukocyte elastase inhibitor-like isoform X2 [Procambarus clarkii]
MNPAESVKEAPSYEHHKEVISLAASQNKFTRDLYMKLAEKSSGNVFFSPLSIMTALGMTYTGASGNTAREMRSLMHLSQDNDALLNAFHDLVKDFKREVADYELRTSNMAYVSEKMTLLSDFDHMLREKFLTSCKTVNFDEDEAVRQEINAAVEKETNARIKDLIPQGFFSNLTRMVLVNAVYFKGSWEQQFMESETFEENFWITENESIMVPMMHIKEDFRMMHNKDLGAKLLAMDYKGSRLSIVFVLPDKRDGLPEIETNLDSLDLNNIDTLMTVEVKVTLPKFKLEESLDLVSHLREMGVRDLFDEGSCDLSRITGNRNLYVSKVVHKAFLEVNEKGSEAAAATAVSIMFCCYRGPPQEFVVDHPFCFFIRDRHSGLVLFAGRFLK